MMVDAPIQPQSVRLFGFVIDARSNWSV